MMRSDMNGVLVCGWVFGLLLTVVSGCAPKAGPPKVVLAAPTDVPTDWQGKKLYNTPNAYIYAATPESAGEADRWLAELKSYISRKHKATLDKGVVIVAEPGDAPVAPTLEEQLAMEVDPALIVTAPRNPKTAAEIRKRLDEEGIPEAPMARAASLPLSAARLAALGLNVPRADWAVVAPSHALASQSGVEVVAASLRKKNPKIDEPRSLELARKFPDMAAKPFEIVRPQPAFVLWAQRQKDWSDSQRREAILDYLKHVLRSHWLPVPEDDELGW
ncbi:hypothetical protein RAS2_02990 [Phycisphaerae bacterium RAS2]|nr:hypothetical protein RAS2_02990 [Phycisphaerae bacterium RAS2]